MREPLNQVFHRHESPGTIRFAVTDDPPVFVRGRARSCSTGLTAPTSISPEFGVDRPRHGHPAILAALSRQAATGLLHIGPHFQRRRKHRSWSGSSRFSRPVSTWFSPPPTVPRQPRRRSRTPCTRPDAVGSLPSRVPTMAGRWGPSPSRRPARERAARSVPPGIGDAPLSLPRAGRTGYGRRTARVVDRLLDGLAAMDGPAVAGLLVEPSRPPPVCGPSCRRRRRSFGPKHDAMASA